ncbi:MAG: hypothetical protein COS34_06415 [Lysobacterales bacterium CG02_land_8_20_14_3_00_62_12]|nr:MAG: hypothetical protein COS34_06415 [Xanthomonadales bacterium CG02_land_8_20_14_3_00_62_12]PJA42156.1 MAG: hypothetical protein CO182_04145 [Xanthomonadales bacterium CG_4_9_14_3_um_filter_62_6]
MTSPLENLSGPNMPLTAEPPDAKEFAGLLRSGKARLQDAAVAGLALESRFDLAYNAAHALCLAALRYSGYRPQHRYLVFQVLPHTLGLGPEVWRVLSKCHDVRNLGEYEGDLNINERLVADLIVAGQTVARQLDALPPLPVSP